MSHRKFLFFLFFAVCVLIYAQGLQIHGIEFYGDEVFYYKSTQEMLTDGDYLSPKFLGADRFQKPIFYYWFILLSYQLFGPGWFGARFVGVFCAGLVTAFTFALADLLFNRRVAVVSAVILMTTLQFFRFARVAVPDMTMNLFIVAAMYFGLRIFLDTASGKTPPAFGGRLFFVAVGCGFMVKGFAALIVPVVSMILYALWLRNPGALKKFNFPGGILIFLLIVLPWFLYMVAVHGQAYLNHMLVEETRNRVLSSRDAGTLAGILQSLIHNIRYYTGVILVDMLPWSVFALFAIPLAVADLFRKSVTDRAGTLAMLVWFFTVFGFFSFVHVMHDHYMLVLTTPFAILTGRFFLAEMKGIPGWFSRSLNWIRRYLVLIALCLAVLALSVFMVMMLAAPLWIVGFFLILIWGLVWGFRKFQNALVPPLAAGFFILFIFSQTRVLADVGFTKNAVFQRFAQRIRQESPEYVVGIGSPDIRLSDVQAYFNQRVMRVPEGYDLSGRQHYLDEFFDQPGDVYCYALEKDFDGNFALAKDRVAVWSTEDVLRRKFRLDWGFLRAFLELDRPRVNQYLMEKVYLVKKNRL